MFFDDWYGVLRVATVGTCAYASLVMLLRISGKRTLGKLNAFDFVVTVALGSILATVLLSSTVALAEGVAAMALLVLLQYAVAWGASRSQRIASLVKSEPVMVYRDGLLRTAMRRERVTPGEIAQAARLAGYADLSQVGAVVLETDGTFSVLESSERLDF